MKLSLRRITALADIPAATWNRLAADDPFLRHEFLGGLEQYDCLAGHGWTPRHLAAYVDGELAGAIPLYRKSNSIGEFVFDHDWAAGCERAGINYYPKLVSAIPFAPVTGSRILLSPDVGDGAQVRAALIKAAMEDAREHGCSGVHFLFPEQADAEVLLQRGFLLRPAFQYHWRNQGYTDFGDFLSRLSSKRRKEINKERAAIRKGGITVEILEGADIRAHHWRIFREFYASTFHRKWGEPRLTLPFFQALGHHLPQAVVLLLARHQAEYIAGAFALRTGTTLYGRHWGCRDQYRFLHFELCYYQTIDYCIRHNLRTLDAGVQGEHKLHRGFLPVPGCSAHWFAHRELHRAVGHYVACEQPLVESYMKQLCRHSSYKHTCSAEPRHDQGSAQQ